MSAMAFRITVDLTGFFNSLFMLTRKEKIKTAIMALCGRARNAENVSINVSVNEPGQHLLRYWLVACSATNHYHWPIANWTLRNKLQWNLDQNTKLLIRENELVNVVCEMAIIVFSGEWVNSLPNLVSAHMFPTKRHPILTLILRHG